MFEDDFIPLNPINFFQIGFDCKSIDAKSWSTKIEKAEFKVPDTSELSVEESFADVHMGWNADGLYFSVFLHVPFQQANYPNYDRGDSVELFIDTRDVKTSGFNTRFCHHFFFLPADVDGVQAAEVTRFRTEDVHELCDPKELKVLTDFSKKSYLIKIFIPSQCLYGYDPEQFDRLGFTYRINRHGGSSQHFSVSSLEYPIEQQPSLWSSVRLVK